MSQSYSIRYFLVKKKAAYRRLFFGLKQLFNNVLEVLSISIVVEFPVNSGICF
jgi:hypothetical protein